MSTIIYVLYLYTCMYALKYSCGDCYKLFYFCELNIQIDIPFTYHYSIYMQYIENDTWQNLYPSPYQPVTPISARESTQKQHIFFIF